MAINPLQQPINYAIDVQSPFEAALGGLKLGAGLAEIDAAQQKRQLEINAAQQAQQRQTDLANLYKNPNATSADYARVAAFLPKDQAAIVTQGFERLTKEQQQSDLRMGGEVYSAIKSGNLDVAKRMLTDKAAALRNSGRESEAKAAEDSLELINLNPTGAQATIGLYMARLPGGKDFLDNADKALGTIRTEAEAPFKLVEAQAKATKAAQEALNAVTTAEDDIAKAAAMRKYEEAKALKERADADVAEATKGTRISEASSTAIIKAAEAKFAPDKFGADLGLTQAQIEASKAARRASDAAAAKSGADATRAQAEANQITAGIIPSEKRPEAETKFRTEYNNQTKPFQEVKTAYSRVLASEDTAVGDLSLIFGYMKMLDPGSVVREGEFATAQNAAGVPERIMNIYNKVATGQRLNSSQRDSFKGQAKKLYQSAGEQETVVRKGLERIAKGYGLNTANIFYTPVEAAPTAPPSTEQRRQQAVAQIPTTAAPATQQRNVTVDY
jgi:hypothetical protein